MQALTRTRQNKLKSERPRKRRRWKLDISKRWIAFINNEKEPWTKLTREPWQAGYVPRRVRWSDIFLRDQMIGNGCWRVHGIGWALVQSFKRYRNIPLVEFWFDYSRRSSIMMSFLYIFKFWLRSQAFTQLAG